MIEKAERFFLPTANGARATVTINPRGPTKDFMTIAIGGKKAVIPTSAFYKLMLMIVTEDEQEKMLPTTQVRRRTFRKIVEFQFPPHLKHGETYAVPVDMEFDLPDGAIPLGSYAK